MHRGKKISAVIGVVMAALMATAAPAAAAVTPTNTVGFTRFGGSDRYGTAAAVAAKTFDAGTDAVFLATGDSYADALSAGPAAGLRGAPVLLVTKNSIPTATVTQLQRMTPSRIYVLGGTGVVSSTVVQQADRLGGTVTRLAGGDRYATGTAVSRAFWSTAPTVYVASGDGYADALSGGALAARSQSPLLQAAPRSLPVATRAELQRLRPARVVLLGGASALSTGVESAIRSAVPGAVVSRIGGADRYATSAAISKAGWGTSTRAFYATGTNFPDALSGVPAAAANGAPLLLTQKSCMPPAIATESYRMKRTVRVGLGGSSVLAESGTGTTCSTAPAAPAHGTTYRGSGDSVISITKPDGLYKPAVMKATYSGSGHFSVNGLDATNQWTDLYVNDLGGYSGTTLIDAPTYSPDRTVRLEISADGPWTLELSSTDRLPTYGTGWTMSGTGDRVFRYTGGTTTRQIQHSGRDHFAVIGHAHATDWDLLVNEIGSYSGRVLFPGPSIYEVTADGAWSIKP
jgi:putative cell wall-binding protein